MAQNRTLSIVCHAILIAGALIVVLPLYFALVAASHNIEGLTQQSFPLLPGGYFLENAVEAWNRGQFGTLFFNSIIVTVGIVVGKLAISILAAFAITYFRFPFRRTAFWLIFISLMLPVEVRIIPTYEAVADVAGPIRWAFDVTGLGSLIDSMTGFKVEAGLNWSMVNTYQGLILPLIASASATFLFRQFFLTIPDELCEAARLDRAGPMRFFWDILLPLSKVNIGALAIILFVYGWNQYLWPLLFTTDKDMATAVLGLKQLVPTSDGEPVWNLAMAASFFVMLPPALIILALQGLFTKGLVDSGK
jgi:sn-glycerol 3-phosphate transport system permease protein